MKLTIELQPDETNADVNTITMAGMIERLGREMPYLNVDLYSLGQILILYANEASRLKMEDLNNGKSE
jgi:hypothetical protein